MPKKYVYLIVLFIIVAATVLAVTSVWNDSLIVDEIPHIGAGYSYLVKQDMRLNPEHPPLAKDLAAIPLLFLNLKQEAFESRFWQIDINGQWEFGRRLIFNSGSPRLDSGEAGNNADLITRITKMPILLFFVLSAVLIFIWSRRLYGVSGGLIALLLFSFSPTVMAHSRLVTTDIAALFGTLFASYFFLKYLQNPVRQNFWLAAAMFGLALLTKFSTFLLIPFFLLLAVLSGLIKTPGMKKSLVSSVKSVWRSVLLMVVGFIIIVWPVYFFHTWHYPAERQQNDTQNLLQSFGKRYLAEPVIWASDKPVLRAAAQYGLGLLMVVQRSAGGNTTYFLGEMSRFGWHSYFPIVYFIKETLSWWILALMAIFSIAIKFSIFLASRDPAKRDNFSRFAGSRVAGQFSKLSKWSKNYFEELAMLLWLAIYWGNSIHSTLNIGARHLLPTFPFAIMLVAGQISKIRNSKFKIRNFTAKIKIVPILIFAVLGWHIYENLNVYPFYLAYFNQVAGGPSGGYRYAVDSNLDWGQDLKRLSRWVEENGLQKIELDYFGWADPAYYLKNRYVWMSSQKYANAQDFIARNQSNGWLAVSATFLQGSEGPPDQYNSVNYLWLKNYTSITTIGHSIFIYRIR